MSDKKILIAGDVMLDIYHFGKVNRISPEAPVPVFLETGKVKNVPGGASNVAVNVAAIGIETALFSVIGTDSQADVLLDLLSKDGIDTSYVKRIKNKATTSKLRFIGPNNQQLLRVDNEDTKKICLETVQSELDYIKEVIDEVGLILLSDYNKGFLSEEIAQSLIHLGKEKSIPVLVDVKDKNLRKYKGAFLLKPNKSELKDLTGMPTDTIDEVRQAAIALCNKADVTYVLTTLSADGMLLVDKTEELMYSKSVAKEVYDVTGAGDTSIAYFAAELLKGKSIYEAIETANYAAGIQVSKVGTSIVYPNEVETAMNCMGNSLNKKILNYYRNNGLKTLMSIRNDKKLVFTNGCFDILHAGHITYLNKARELGDLLVVGINSDASVKRLKGENRPVNTIRDRSLLLSALEFVDYVIPFEEDTPYELIKVIMPDVLVKGGDYAIESIVGRDVVEKNGGFVTTIPLVEGKSTTNIINKMQEVK